MTTIIGVSLENRMETALKFQEIVTNHGCHIKTRIGLHPAASSVCLNRGIILLEVFDGAEHLQEELCKYWQIQTMKFE